MAFSCERPWVVSSDGYEDVSCFKVHQSLWEKSMCKSPAHSHMLSNIFTSLAIHPQCRAVQIYNPLCGCLKLEPIWGCFGSLSVCREHKSGDTRICGELMHADYVCVLVKFDNKIILDLFNNIKHQIFFYYKNTKNIYLRGSVGVEYVCLCIHRCASDSRLIDKKLILDLFNYIKHLFFYYRNTNIKSLRGSVCVQYVCCCICAWVHQNKKLGQKSSYQI